MAVAPALTEAVIWGMASPESFERGRRYFAQGAVVRLARRGEQLEAEVEGSSYLPYQVRVTLGAGGVGDATCSCPYDWGGVCKHIVAALLACLETPEEIEERPPLAPLLSELDRDQLQTLVLGLLERRPDLADLIEGQALALQHRVADGLSGTPPAARPRQTAVDPATFRRQVRAALHSLDRMRPTEAYWHTDDVVADVRDVMEQARPFLEAGDGRNALLILEAVTEEYVGSWFELDDSDGELGALFTDLGALWTEALLTADLTADERRAWAQRMANWAAEVGDYGIDDAFGAAEAAALQGWDDPDLQRALRGEASAADDDVGVERWYADDLARARLAVLERQGRLAEYLNLAAAKGQDRAYVTMLVRLGRTAEAVAYGMTGLTTTDDALTLAQALHERGATEDALRVAEHGLRLQGHRLTLARWLRDLAVGAGATERALPAAQAAVRESADLADYQAVETLAGDQWPAVRDELLRHLRRTAKAFPGAGVEVLLYEGLIDEAIAIADAAPYNYRLVEQVADAALASHPEWVIRACRAQAERIMDEGKSQYYQYAARWLEKARRASLATGRDDEWRTYMEELLARHRRKYSLVPLLQPLR